MSTPSIARVFILITAVAVLTPAPAAHADPAATTSATATGMQSAGRLSVAPTPTVTATHPGEARRQADGVKEEAAGPVAVRATMAVVAEARLESSIGTPVFPELQDNARRRHNREHMNNARAFVEARSVALTVSSPVPTTVVEATSVQAAAVARCQDNQAIFDTDFQLTGLKVLGQDASLDRLNQPIQAGLDPPLSISVKPGEAGKLPSGGIFMNGLHITIPALDVDLVVARSEARMPTPCGTGRTVEEPTRLGTPVPTGRTTLASTGGARPLAVLGSGLAVLAFALVAVNRRARRPGR